MGCKYVKNQIVSSHKTQLMAKLSLFLSYDNMFRPTTTAIVRLYMKPFQHICLNLMCGWGWGCLARSRFGVVLGEVCWYINIYEALVDYCSVS